MLFSTSCDKPQLTFFEYDSYLVSHSHLEIGSHLPLEDFHKSQTPANILFLSSTDRHQYQGLSNIFHLLEDHIPERKSPYRTRFDYDNYFLSSHQNRRSQTKNKILKWLHRAGTWIPDGDNSELNLELSLAKPEKKLGKINTPENYANFWVCSRHKYLVPVVV